MLLLLSVLALAGCGGGGAAFDGPMPRADDAAARPGDIYQRLGFLAGPPSYAAVASFATVAGAADSTLVLFSMSLPANALRFQREGGGFLAEYNVELVFTRDGVTAARVQRRESIRVATFAETTRTDESVVFQSMTALAPGSYEVQVFSNDAHSSRGFRGVDTLSVPAFGPGRTQLGTPIVVYEAEGRTARGALPDIVANPRRTISYGGTARVYIEAYDTLAVPIHVHVRDEFGEAIWRGDATIEDRGDAIGYAVIDIPADSLPLGRLSVEVVSAREHGPPEPLVLTISEQWLVGSIDEVVQFVRYIATRQELDELVAGTAAERRANWEAFWARRDPLPATAANEFRDEFFRRIRHAADNFSDPGRPGWRTDRGEVYIVLGPPDFATERSVGRADMGPRPAGLEWLYEQSPVGRLQLTFVDRSGFGRYELVPASLSNFRAAADRLRQATTH